MGQEFERIYQENAKVVMKFLLSLTSEEELQLEGDGKYYYLLLLTMHSVRTEDGSWTVEIPEAKGIYIDMK